MVAIMVQRLKALAFIAQKKRKKKEKRKRKKRPLLRCSHGQLHGWTHTHHYTDCQLNPNTGKLTISQQFGTA